MTISFELPQDIEQHIRTDGGDLNRDAKEVYLMEQYRQAKLSPPPAPGRTWLEFPGDRGGNYSSGVDWARTSMPLNLRRVESDFRKARPQ